MTVPTRRMKLSGITPQMVEEIRSLRFEPIPPIRERDFDFIPGQFVQISTRPGMSAYFAIASSPEDRGCLELLVKRGKGVASDLFELPVGSEVGLTGPQGKGFPIDEHKGKNLLFIGVGTGIAPLRSALRSALVKRREFGDLILIYGALTPKHLCYMDDLHHWNRNSVQVHLTVTFPEESSWIGHAGLVQEILGKVRPTAQNTVAMLVGMNEMIQENTRLLLEIGFSAKNILLNY